MYKFLNVEPNNEKMGDCVIRALSLALAIPYSEAVELLYKNGLENQCEEICLPCYSKILEDMGYTAKRGNGLLIKELIYMLNDKVLLIRIKGHLTCAVDGCIYDIWDCRNKEVDCYWIID